MPYLILFKKSAYKELEKLPISVQEDITKSIAKLSENPRPNGCIRLKGSSLLWRIRIGDYRVIYSIVDNILSIEIVRIGHRREVYD
jgi:mRNA interferase RelE/StbE